MNQERLLEGWKRFLREKSCSPGQRPQLILMMQQVLHRFPPGRLKYVSDRDLAVSVHLDSAPPGSSPHELFPTFVDYLDRFLEQGGMTREP